MKDYSVYKTKRDVIDCDFYFSGTLEEMIGELQQILTRHPGKVIKIDYDTVREEQGWHTEYGYQHSIYIERLETEEEYQTRIVEEKTRLQKHEDAERKQLETLQKKYGNK